MAKTWRSREFVLSSPPSLTSLTWRQSPDWRQEGRPTLPCSPLPNPHKNRSQKLCSVQNLGINTILELDARWPQSLLWRQIIIIIQPDPGTCGVCWLESNVSVMCPGIKSCMIKCPLPPCPPLLTINPQNTFPSSKNWTHNTIWDHHFKLNVGDV